jgi:CheY-like chemotaxis protein
MAMNEGAQAFLPSDFEPSALVNYVERSIFGPGRLRPRAFDPQSGDETFHLLEEALGEARNRNLGYQKVIKYLLATPPRAQNRRVLVVSDSPYQLEMLKKILEEHNFQVFTAPNATDGLNLILNDGPRLIVSDLELEGQTGVEFCQAVKFTNKVVPCFFVICTANKSKIDQVLSPGNGVDDCILKPSGTHDTMEFVARLSLGLLL